MRVEQVPDPKILNQRDTIIRITSTAICGSDLHLYNGYIPTMEPGDILGHEFMGEVVEVGRYERGGAETINYEEKDVYDTLMEMTGGRGPDACIDAVGMEAHAPGIVHAYDRAKQAVMLEMDRPYALRQAILACRNGGTVSVIGIHGGFIDKFPFGSVMNRSLTIKTGQAHVQRYMQPLLGRIQNGEIDPSFVITHRMPLEDAPKEYDIFLNKKGGCIKIVLNP